MVRIGERIVFQEVDDADQVFGPVNADQIGCREPVDSVSIPIQDRPWRSHPQGNRVWQRWLKPSKENQNDPRSARPD